MPAPKFVASLAVALTGLLTLSAAAETEPVLLETFDSDEPGEIHRQLDSHDLLEVVPGEGVDGSNALKARYVGYDRGSRRIVRRIPLSRPLEEATLSYDVKFDEDFDFVRGGKLHGLGPVRTLSGGNPRQPDRWSARINFNRHESLSTYLYDQSEGSQWGRSQSNTSFSFERGRYYAVSMHMKLNDPGEENGFAHIYLDGERIVSHDDVSFRGVGGEDTLIHQFLISTFHGGSSPRWAPTDEDGEYITVHAYFDNFAVYPGRVIRPEPGAEQLPDE